MVGRCDVEGDGGVVVVVVVVVVVMALFAFVVLLRFEPMPFPNASLLYTPLQSRYALVLFMAAVVFFCSCCSFWSYVFSICVLHFRNLPIIHAPRERYCCYFMILMLLQFSCCNFKLLNITFWHTPPLFMH